MISFLKSKPGFVEGYSGNMTYGLVFCEIICKQPLLDFNGPLSNIDGVVNQVTHQSPHWPLLMKEPWTSPVSTRSTLVFT